MSITTTDDDRVQAARRAKQCVTHHRACDCREYAHQRQIAALTQRVVDTSAWWERHAAEWAAGAYTPDAPTEGEMSDMTCLPMAEWRARLTQIAALEAERDAAREEVRVLRTALKVGLNRILATEVYIRNALAEKEGE